VLPEVPVPLALPALDALPLPPMLPLEPALPADPLLPTDPLPLAPPVVPRSFCPGWVVLPFPWAELAPHTGVRVSPDPAALPAAAPELPPDVPLPAA
jgi:hypothetical protein